MRYLAYSALSLWGLTRALVAGPFYVMRFFIRALLIREVLRWVR